MSLICKVKGDKDTYFRTLIGDGKEDFVCADCKDYVDFDVYFCPSKKIVWHKACLLKQKHHHHWNGVQGEHTDLKIDKLEIKPNDENVV